jgi:chitinase
MSHRPLALIFLAVLAGLVGAFGMPSFSTALFTSTSTATGTVRAAADWTPPTVTVTSPGVSVAGTVTIAATAADGETGVQSVTIQVQPAGGATWTTLCTDTTAPYSCAWTTTGLPDGPYDIRARATDGAGYTSTSASVRTTVANTVTAVLTPPDDVVRGAVPLQASVFGTGTASYTVTIEWTVAGGTQWRSVAGCTTLPSPYTCTWGTTAFANGDYDLRAVAVITGGTGSSPRYVSAVVTDITVDNLAPTVTMTDPGSPLSGTRTFAATAGDAHSGVDQVVIQAAPTGSTSFTTLCTVTSEPFSCRVDTRTLTDGSYSLRAVATDVAGNTTTSATVGNRLVDNIVSSVLMDDPGAFLSGTVTLLADAASAAGVTSVRIQRAAAGTTTWQDVCTDTTAPYSCGWDTTTVADGPYDLRAVLLDGTGAETVSSVVAGRQVDNSPLRSVDVQTVNGEGTPGRPDAGDVISLTYNDLAALGTITPGWSGGPVPVTVRLRDGNAPGLALGPKRDVLDVQRAGSSVSLGTVQLNQDYVKTQKATVFTATMTATTVTVAGVPATQVVLVLGSAASGAANVKTVSATSTMTWQPVSGVTDTLGRAASTASVNEGGAADREF